MTDPGQETSTSDPLATAVAMVRQCAQAEAVVQEIYQELQRSIDERQPVCAASGKCCGFDRYGHRLYVTPLELGVFLGQLEGQIAGQLKMESSREAGDGGAAGENAGDAVQGRSGRMSGGGDGIGRDEARERSPAGAGEGPNERREAMDGKIEDKGSLAGGGMPGSANEGKISLAVLAQQADGGGCRFQSGGLCSVHGIRPFGCRIFFCDPTAEQWQQAEYERFHGQIKAAHERLGIPYLYVEWRMALRASCFAEATQDSVER